MSSWTLELLGNARLTGPSGAVRVERKTAALLAFIALEGPQPKAKVAGLFWPESPDRTARTNLRQLLHRFRDAAGGDVLTSGDPLGLSAEVEIDVVRLRAQAAAGAFAEAAKFEGPFLAGLEVDDAAELSEWLARTREELDRVRVQASLAESERLEKAGQLTEATAQVHRTLALDPLSEQAHRQLMRLLYLAGDRAAALSAFERCRTTLKDALQVEPSPVTAKLADEIARGRRVPARRTAPGRIPLSIQRPPVLAGREREWAQMEEAWEAGISIVLGGAPGVGKSRLMQDFLTAHARPIFLSGRPGDRVIPYGTHARTYREMIDAVGGPTVLPEWVRRELSRLIPAWGDGRALSALESDEEKLRFWQAKIEAHKIAFAHGYDALGFDDLQYVDPASTLAGAYVLAQLRVDEHTPVRTVHCFRAGELPEDILAVLRENAAAGHMLLIELEPLAPTAVTDLLQSLDVPGLDALAPQVAKYTGGNPLFVVETVKHLLETGHVDGTFPEHLPPPGRVGPVLQRRFERLSPSALQLARTLAVLGNEFSLELAGVVMQADGLELSQAWAELETAQLVRGSSFGHDLLAEAVVAGMPEPVRALLHRRAAEALELAGAAAGRIAAHWLQAGDPERAADRLVQAEAEARTSMLRHEAAGYYQSARSSSTRH